MEQDAGLEAIPELVAKVAKPAEVVCRHGRRALDIDPDNRSVMALEDDVNLAAVAVPISEEAGSADLHYAGRQICTIRFG